MALSARLIQLVGVVITIRISAILFCGFAILIPLAPSSLTLAMIVLLFGASGGGMMWP